MKTLLWGLVALCTISMPAWATASADPLRKAILERAEPSAFTANGVDGPGWKALLAAAKDAGVVLLGEQHGVGEIIDFAAALQRRLHAEGFDYAAYEIGPYGAADAEHLIRAGGKAFETAAVHCDDRFLFPFVYVKEDAAFVRQIVEAAPHAGRLWGIDQEFVGSGPLLADRLSALAMTSAQKQAVAAFQALATRNWMLLGSAPETTFDALHTAFAGTDGAAIVDAMILSNRIYSPFTGRGGTAYEANSLREELMKANFTRIFAATEAADGKPPRVFMKFGANHAMRGFSTTNVPALGNFIAEWGTARGVSMLNVLVDCAGGEMQTPTGPVPCETVAATPGSAFADAAASSDITVIDLRPLRALVKRSSAIDAETRRTLFAFDFYVVIREPKAAVPLK